ncbi:MAG: aminoacyl-tRNA hydrolase [Chloroflexi bacterium]|nr:aminoacyl-tRNA hydrolase [Chloroflexota bacterium]
MDQHSEIERGEAGALFVAPGVSIPLSELRWRFSRSAGPGGQNVNKVETRAELIFNPAASRAFGPTQRRLVLEHIAARLDDSGDLHIVAGEYRSQHQNREAACRRLQSILADALRPRRRRIATRVPFSTRTARLESKKRRSDVKKGRTFHGDDDGG